MPKTLNFKFWHWFAGHPNPQLPLNADFIDMKLHTDEKMQDLSMNVKQSENFAIF